MICTYEVMLAIVRFAAAANIKILRHRSGLLLLGLTSFVKAAVAGAVVSEVRGKE